MSFTYWTHLRLFNKQIMFSHGRCYFIPPPKAVYLRLLRSVPEASTVTLVLPKWSAISHVKMPFSRTAPKFPPSFYGKAYLSR